MNIKAGNATTPITIEYKKEGVNIESTSTQININSDSPLAPIVQAIISIQKNIANIDATGVKEETLIAGIADIRQDFANIDLSTIETTIVNGFEEVKETVVVNSVEKKVDQIIANEVAQQSTLEEVKLAVENIPQTDLSSVAKESTLDDIKATLADIKSLTESIGVISNDDIDALIV